MLCSIPRRFVRLGFVLYYIVLYLGDLYHDNDHDSGQGNEKYLQLILLSG
jgi:hypothetical protein